MIQYIKLDCDNWSQFEPGIMALEALTFSPQQCHPASFYLNILKAPRQISSVALDKDKVIGFLVGGPLELFGRLAGVKGDPYWNTGKVLYGAGMVVDPQYRKQGIGMAFKRDQLEQARALGYVAVAGRNRLEHAAVMWRVNQKLGAVEIQRLKGIYIDGREPNECIYYQIPLE